MELEHDSYYGVIDEKTDDRDYMFGDVSEIPRTPKGTQSFLLNGATQYRQYDIQKNSCTLHAAMGSYTDLTGHKFSLDERQEIYQEALKRGFDPSIGWYISEATKLIADWTNGNLKDKVEYYRLSTGREDYLQALRLGYSPIIGYRGNKTYNEDRDDDGILNGVGFGKTTYGHALRSFYIVGDSLPDGTSTDGIADNYPDRSTNLYRVPTSNWSELVNRGVMFHSAYIYIIT